MRLRIPEQHKAGFISILRLSDLQARQLADQLTKILATTKLGEIAAQIAPALPELDAPELSRIVRTLYSLYQLRASAEVDLDRFITDLVGAIQETPELQIDVPTSEFTQRLSTLLAVDQLGNHARAYALQREYEHIFHEARVLTDVRPIFGTDPKQPPVGVIVTHTMKIVYHEAGGEHTEIFLSLDENDIINLRKVLDRATDKAQALSVLLGQRGIQNLEF